MRRLLPILGFYVVVALAASAAAALGQLSLGTALGVACACGALLLASLAVASAMPGQQLYAPAICRGSAAGTQVALSFDDGPDPASTERLLAALREAGARATFFVLADKARRYPDLLRAVAAEHEVALHGPSHDPWLVFQHPERGAARRLPRPPARCQGEGDPRPERGAARLIAAAQQLEEITGLAVRWFRPPFGVTSPRLAQALAHARLDLVWCSLRTLDGVLGDGQRLRRICARARAGDIVLLHEGACPARDALPLILRDLAARGLHPVTVGELLEGR